MEYGEIIMNLKKRIIVFILLLLAIIFLLVIAVLDSCQESDMRSRKAVSQFAKLVEQGEMDSLSLKIYFMSPYTLTPYPYSIDDIIRATSEDEIIIIGSSLKEHIDVLKQLNNDRLVKVEQESYIDARVYYVFYKGTRKIFDVAMWGKDNSIFVNGFEIKEDDIFYDIIIPFLPEGAIDRLRDYLFWEDEGAVPPS